MGDDLIRKLKERVRWEFTLEKPSAHVLVLPPESGVFQAKLCVADFLRTRGANSELIATGKLLAAAGIRHPACLDTSRQKREKANLTDSACA